MLPGCPRVGIAAEPCLGGCSEAGRAVRGLLRGAEGPRSRVPASRSGCAAVCSCCKKVSITFEFKWIFWNLPKWIQVRFANSLDPFRGKWPKFLCRAFSVSPQFDWGGTENLGALHSAVRSLFGQTLACFRCSVELVSWVLSNKFELLLCAILVVVGWKLVHRNCGTCSLEERHM